MLNNFIAVGLAEDFSSPQTDDSGDVFVMLTLRVTRPFKNGNGEYDSDLIKIKVSHSLAKECVKHLKSKSIVGVKCHIHNISPTPNFIYEIIAEKISIVSN